MTSSNDHQSSKEELLAHLELCQLVGLCLSQFSLIEERLAALFGTASGIPLMETAFRTHDAIREFRYRLDATNAAVELWISSLPDPQTKSTFENEWNALHGIINEDSKDRNRLAHFRIAPNDNKDGTTTYFVCPYFQFFSHLSDMRGKDGKAKIPDGVRKFDSKSLEAKGERFENTVDRIDRFLNRLRKHGAQIPKIS